MKWKKSKKKKKKKVLHLENGTANEHIKSHHLNISLLLWLNSHLRCIGGNKGRQTLLHHLISIKDDFSTSMFILTVPDDTLFC